MKTEASERGFLSLVHPTYPPGSEEDDRIITESSAIGDYKDSFDKAGSSYLWFGINHHLDRKEVKSVIRTLQYWLKNKRLPSPDYKYDV